MFVSKSAKSLLIQEREREIDRETEIERDKERQRGREKRRKITCKIMISFASNSDNAE